MASCLKLLRCFLEYLGLFLAIAPDTSFLQCRPWEAVVMAACWVPCHHLRDLALVQAQRLLLFWALGVETIAWELAVCLPLSICISAEIEVKK